MTSSFTIKKINEQRDLWNYALPNATLGGMEDRYIRTQGECHPDFAAIPIGNPQGANLCVRRLDPCGNTIGTMLQRKSEKQIEDSQGFYRGSVNLYDVKDMVPYQQINPEEYSSRRIPWEGDLVRRDYLHRQINYGATGITPVRTPHELLDADKPYWSYDFVYTPIEDPLTGRRVATKLSDNVPPPKYDITQLHQRYPVALKEAEIVGNTTYRGLDVKYQKRYI